MQEEKEYCKEALNCDVGGKSKAFEKPSALAVTCKKYVMRIHRNVTDITTRLVQESLRGHFII